MTNSCLSFALKSAAAGAFAVALAGCGCSQNDSAAEAPSKSAAVSVDTNSVSYIQSEAQKAFADKDWPGAIKAYCRLAYDSSLPPEAQSVGWAGKGLVDFARLEEPGASNDLCDTARASFMHAVRLDRRNPMARYHLGKLYMDQYGFYQSAIEQFESYVALMKGTDDPRVEKVKKWIESLKSQSASNTTVRNPSACADALRRGDGLYAKKFYTKARDSYEVALKADALCYDAALRLAQCLEITDKSKAGRKKALKIYLHAAGLRTYAKPLLSGAAIAEGLDMRAVASSLYSRALAASPTNRKAIDGLIRMLEKNGEKRAATAYKRYRNALPAEK